MLVEKMTEYDVFTEALSNSKKDTCIIVPRTKVIDFLKICVTNCVGDKYRFVNVDIDYEDWCEYLVSFIEDRNGIVDVFINSAINRDTDCYMANECGILYIDTECDADVLFHTKSEEIHIFDTRC